MEGAAPTLHALHDGSCSLPRLSATTTTASALAAALSAGPVILTDAADRWPAAEAISTLFCGHTNKSASTVGNCTLGARTLAAHAARSCSPATRHYRALIRDADSDCPRLRPVRAAARCAARGARCRARRGRRFLSGSRDWRFALVGAAGGGTPWHVDAYNTSAWNAGGARSCALYPPAAALPAALRDVDYRTQYGRDAPRAWFSEALPALPTAARPLLCTQRAGEILTTPPGWWHTVLNLSPHFALSHNFVLAAPWAQAQAVAEVDAQWPALAAPLRAALEGGEVEGGAAAAAARRPSGATARPIRPPRRRRRRRRHHRRNRRRFRRSGRAPAARRAPRW